MVLALAGCGDEPGTPAAPDTIVRASRAVIARGGYHMVMRATIDADGDAEQPAVVFSMAGDISRRPYRADYTFDLGALAAVPSVTASAADLRGHAIVRGTTYYVTLPAMRKQLRKVGVRATWLADDQTKPVNAAGQRLRELLGGGRADPGSVLDYLDAARGKVIRLGRERVAGTTTHYRGEAHMARFGDTAPADVRALLKANARRLVRLGGSKTVPLDVWIDANGLVRRTTIHYRFTRLPSGRRVRVTMNVVCDLSGFGRRVRATPPPSDQVVAVHKLAGVAK
jgi:hypothetical protein